MTISSSSGHHHPLYRRSPTTMKVNSDMVVAVKYDGGGDGFFCGGSGLRWWRRMVIGVDFNGGMRNVNGRGLGDGGRISFVFLIFCISY